MDHKQDPTICYLQVTLFRFKDTQLESEMMGRRYAIQMETKRKRDSYTYIRHILIEFKQKTLKRDKKSF